jgi:hypothetical protein
MPVTPQLFFLFLTALVEWLPGPSGIEIGWRVYLHVMFLFTSMALHCCEERQPTLVGESYDAYVRRQEEFFLLPWPEES